MAGPRRRTPAAAPDSDPCTLSAQAGQPTPRDNDLWSAGRCRPPPILFQIPIGDRSPIVDRSRTPIEQKASARFPVLACNAPQRALPRVSQRPSWRHRAASQESGYVRRVQGWTPIRRQRLVELAVSILRTIERPLMADRALDRACRGACGRGAEQRRWRSIDAPAAALDPAVPDRRRSGPTHRRRPLHERTDTSTTLRNGTLDKTISTTAGA